jgi:hypothetical protein
MQRIIWWLDFLSMVMTVTTALVLLSVFSDAVSVKAFVPTQSVVTLAVMGAAGYRVRREKR